MREFVAVDVGASPGRRSHAPEHLTLRFLGEVPGERTPRLLELLAPVGEQSRPFRMRLEGVGAFPDRSRPRVLWQGVTDGREELLGLAERVRAALAPEFGAADEAFVPHLTLWRVRTPADREAAAELLSGVRPAPPPRDVRVERFELKESVLDRGGAIHRTLATFALGSRPGVVD